MRVAAQATISGETRFTSTMTSAGLAGEQGDPAALAPGVRQERLERGELPRGRRRRRRQAERARKCQQVGRGHSQI